MIDPRLIHQCDGRVSCNPKFHQPGGRKKKAHILHTSLGRSCKTVEALVEDDLNILLPTTFEAKCPAHMSKIALVTHPGEDYHFYKEVKNRKTRKTAWLHKDGGNPAKDYDADGLPIFNPEYASRDYRPQSFLNYKDFCGFFCIPNSLPMLERDES
jgi:hypothetical protein